ncbi:hypothetical protein [Cognatiyoonia sp. IB215182]|uniref:hypothetical protein n=1 Tax=Cognatiyoonia sp. IB215182 TaxID=3097353 RepID=UPI002A1646C9|nr:hypothetical protein [Cognatiyoonia sp. IB215182]MDX8352759.1 hypothetical protein [Cognatiyoonia sp. IB215182]
MPTVADYIVLNDRSFTLIEGESREIGPFDLPSNFVRGTSRAKPILAYRAKALGSADGALAPQARLRVSIQNGLHPLETVFLEGDGLSGQWEAFSGNFLNDVVLNDVTFTLEMGRIWISDVILWYQVRI